MRFRATLFLIAALAGCGAKGRSLDPASAAIGRAARFLWGQQGADGGWHSDTYGLLRSGQSLAPLVLGVLLQVPADLEVSPPGAVDRAMGFIRTHLDADGALGRSDPSIEDYPNYSTALAIETLTRAGGREGIDRMVACLRRQQFVEEQGWPKDHPAYGAWGMGGPPRRPPHTGHLDLSMTRHALQGLAAAGLEPGDPAFVRARIFLDRCRNDDGGFFFSTVITDANKAGEDGTHPRSYGTATADGILSLLATGANARDSRVSAAVAWLLAHHRVDRVPGFPQDFPKDWAAGMIYYYLAASSRVLRDLRIEEAPAGRSWRKDVAEALASRQKPGGSFKNSNFLMKEDDPLIATSLALAALLAAR